eukprot:509555_1
MGTCLASCLYTCECCVCDCCYVCLMNGYCGKHDGAPGENMFNSPLGLTIYNKWCKDDETYKFRNEIFNEVSRSANNGKLEVNEEDKVDEDLVVLDFGCGTGIFTEILCQTFLTNHNDTLICMDISPQCIQFVRDKVVESNKDLKHFHVEYYCNNENSLDLETRYNENSMDIILMSFVMHHISIQNDNRDCILKELYKACKINGILVIFEYGPEFMKEMHGKYHHKIHDEQQPLKDDENMNTFETFEDIKQYVETFGFVFGERIMEDTFGDKQWLLLFRKTEQLYS